VTDPAPSVGMSEFCTADLYHVERAENTPTGRPNRRSSARHRDVVAFIDMIEGLLSAAQIT